MNWEPYKIDEYQFSFSSFQETGQTATNNLLNLSWSPDNTAANKKYYHEGLQPLKFSHKVLVEYPEHF